MASAKKELRRQVAAALRAQDGAELERQSRRVAERVCALPEFAAARSLSVYLAMPREAATEELLAAAFAADRKVFVPKITGRGAEDMCMLHARSLEDVAAFPKDNWEIPDPPLLHADGSSRDDALETLELELVLLPGVAFDRAGGRLGHGKGYYDSFLRRLGEACAAQGRAPPTTVLLEQVPLSPHDRLLDVVVTPEEVIRVPQA